MEREEDGSSLCVNPPDCFVECILGEESVSPVNALAHVDHGDYASFPPQVALSIVFHQFDHILVYYLRV